MRSARRSWRPLNRSRRRRDDINFDRTRAGAADRVGREGGRPMMRCIGIVTAFALGLAGGGCQGTATAPKDYTPTWARFYLESPATEAEPLVLPRSGVHLGVESKPVLAENDVINV